MRWAPVSMQARTTLLENINISARANFDLYGIDSLGKTVSDFALSANNKLMRLTSVGSSVDLSLDRLLTGRKSTDQSQGSTGSGYDRTGSTGDDHDHDDTERILTDRYGYADFDMPWTLNLSYSINYSKPSLKSTISQTLSFNGSVTITKKMLMDYTSGYDFESKAITMTQIGIRRDLHCWIMSFNWVPNGSMKGWNFTIRAKASVLGDLKYDRRKDFHDPY